MYSWLLQHDISAKHIVRIPQKAHVYLSVNWNSWLGDLKSGPQMCSKALLYFKVANIWLPSVIVDFPLVINYLIF